MTDSTNNIHTLLSEFYEIQSELDALEFMQGQLREKINIETKALGGKINIRGLASVSIIPPSESHSYDTKLIDALLSDAVADGDIHTAQKISSARRISLRKESLRIMRDK
jgi:hypothetical protein